MGRAISVLVDQELAAVVGVPSSETESWFEEHTQSRLAEREAALTERETQLAKSEERIQRWNDHLRDREREVEACEWRLELAQKLAGQPTPTPQGKTGRNERCPCGSGLKYKNCHGR